MPGDRSQSYSLGADLLPNDQLWTDVQLLFFDDDDQNAAVASLGSRDREGKVLDGRTITSRNP